MTDPIPVEAPPPPVMVVGEALIDIVDGSELHEIPGGSPANVALGLGRLGVPVEFVTCLGDDPRGHRIATHLAHSRVRLERDVFSTARTSTATVRLSDTGQPRYQFDITWNPPRRPHPPKRLHVGSIGAFLEPGAHTVLDLVTRTRQAGGTVSFDPNIRPDLLPSPAETRHMFERLVKYADIVKLSDEDAHWLYPTLTPDTILDRLHTLGVALAVLTAGEHGSTLSTRRHTVFVPSAPTTVVDTVGAGDTYMATLLWALSPHSLPHLTAPDLQQVGTVCAAAAAITVSRPGADLPSAADLPSRPGQHTSHALIRHSLQPTVTKRPVDGMTSM